MNYDLGLNSKIRRPYWPRGGIPSYRELEFSIFALTPGIPTEFVSFWCQFKYRKKSFEVVNRLRDIAEPLAIENAASITEQDGRAMVIPYGGPLPHWGSLALYRMCKEDGWKVTRERLGVSPMWLIRHRKSAYDPLTLRRITDRKGTPGVAREYQVTR